MANISFGLDINENVKTNGYDLYKSTLGETLGAVAEDAWNFNPLPSAIRFFELEANRNEDTNEPLISRDELNKKYSNLDLFFEQDEKQSTVDILVNRKTLERERQSIIARGPEGSFNPFNSENNF